MTDAIRRRNDAGLRAGGHRYGDAQVAGSMKRQNLNEIWEQIRAAWSYINQKENAAKYDEVAVEIIKDRIKQSARNQGIEITD